MAQRFSRPRLIDFDDRQYRAFVAQIMLGKDNQRAIRPPSARDLFGGEAEEALRGWLEQRLTLSPRRLVEYQEHRGRSAVKKYRELDAVVIDSPKEIQVFEIKASRKATSLRRASRQLRDTRSILGMLYARVYTTILLVDTGIPTAEDVAALMREPDAPFEPPPTLDEMLEALPQIKLVSGLDERPRDPELVSLLRFSLDDIIALAGAENLHLDWDEDEEAEDELPEAADVLEVEPIAPEADEAEDEDEGGGALAEALRRAMEAQEKKRR